MALSDAGIKTYELGGRSAMVAAGHALPALTATEVVRPIIETHNRNNAKPIGFYDTVRLLAFFLKRATPNPDWSSEVAIVGFLDSGRPCLAHTLVSAHQNRVRFFSVDEGGSRALPVGNRDAGRFLLQGLSAARKEGRPVVPTGISLLWYMSCHPGAFESVGGALSVGSCRRTDTYFSWPHIMVSERRFYRGFDVTNYTRPGWPSAEIVPYDEKWCAELDLRLHRDQKPVSIPIAADGGGYDIDSLSAPETLFQLHDDPIAFDNGMAREG
jgi:hypothetical protein